MDEPLFKTVADRRIASMLQRHAMQRLATRVLLLHWHAGWATSLEQLAQSWFDGAETEFRTFKAMNTTYEYRSYVFAVSYEAKYPACIVNFSDIPDIITSDVTLGVAFSNACEELDLHMECLQKLGKRIPKPKPRLVVESVK